MSSKPWPGSRLGVSILLLALACSREPAPAAQAPASPARGIDPRCPTLATRPNAGPVLLEGEEPSYPLQALAAGAEGRVSAGCTITDEGRVVDCAILKSDVPAIDASVIAALQGRIYCPATKDASPLAVRRTFSFRFQLADDAPARRSARK